MPVTENLAVQTHQQDTDYYCGAACAQMVLETMGAGILDQDDLYADNHAHSTLDAGVNWATGPDGLQWTMMDRRPPAFTNYFALYALDSEDLISRKLCWTIHHYQVAPIALVYGWAHWIVVRGYTASAHPASSGDNSYTIDAFDINNPWPPSPSFYDPALAPPPPHNAGDGCGSGGDRGVANEHVTYATWQSTYMTGVPGGHWNGKFVAVCDPEPPAARGGPLREPRKRRGSGELIAPKLLADLALAGLRDYGLHERKDWAQALRQATPQPGVLVQRLDRLDSFYALVAFQAKKNTVAFAAVDGRWGDYQQAVLLPKAQPERSRLTLDQAFDLIVGKRIDLGDRKGRLLVRKQAVCIYPHLVWRPCLESLSVLSVLHVHRGRPPPVRSHRWRGIFIVNARYEGDLIPISTTTDALVQARRLLNLSPSAGGSVWRVRRLDRDGAYFLVHVADHVACLDSATGELLTSAVAGRTPVAVTHEVAVERAALGGTPTVELVWAPCAATMSMFDPLWSVTLDRQRVFLDQRAKVWHTLPAKGPGGAAV